MAIHFKKIRWQNLLSTGNQWTEVQLDKSDTTLIVGENGAGKSTLLDAVIFSLYGRPYRNVSKNLLVNSITNKNTMVEIEFVVRNKNYLVRRGIKPNVFEIYKDDTLVEQHASVKEYQDYLEKSVIGMNQKSFTQIVVVGSANFTPFMQLKPIERRAVIEDLLDIEIFTKMFMILKGKMSINRDQLIEFKHNIEMVKQKIDFTKKHINDIMSIKNSDLDSKKEKLSKLVEYMEELIDTNKTLNEEIQALSATITDEDKISSTLKKLSKYEIQMNSKIDRLNTEIKFLKDNDVCTTCGQDIDASFKDSNINQINDNIVEIETGLNQLTEELEKCNSRMMEISSVQKDIITRQKS
jgi:DNA repair exonuclease SbcCD ATPase subunit